MSDPRDARALLGSLPGLLGLETPYPDEARAEIEPGSFAEAASALHDGGRAPLVALTAMPTRGGRPSAVHAVFSAPHVPRETGTGGRLLTLVTRPAGEPARYPSLAPRVPAARWPEQEVRDLFGIVPEGHPDPHPLVLAEGWPEGFHPLDVRFDPGLLASPAPALRPVSRTSAPGVFWPSAGPVRAGFREAVHTRFEAAGEEVLRAEVRLFWKHRGMEKRCEGMAPEEAIFLVERLCGRCSVALAVAFSEAVEKVLGSPAPPRAAALRTVWLECERLRNHAFDLLAIAEGAGSPFGASRVALVRESLLRLGEDAAGHRYLFGTVVPGGMRRDLGADSERALLSGAARAVRDLRTAIAILEETGAFTERLRATAPLAAGTARALGAVGPVARASGIETDARLAHPHAAYAACPPRALTLPDGDALARFRIRIQEAEESLEILRAVLGDLPPGAVARPAASVAREGWATGVAESARGAVAALVALDDRGRIARLHLRSASLFNWPPAATALAGTRGSDLSLAGASFGLCSSCVDR